MARPPLTLVALVAMVLAGGGVRAAEEEPTRWEQLFFPFPIVGAPPQLEQQVQLFMSVFTGNAGGGVVPAVEAAVIVTPHLGFVATLPYQLGFSGQPRGLGDATLLMQYLAGGSLRLDDLFSVGLEVTVPTAQSGLGTSDVLFGPFIFAGQRFWRRFILELDVTALVPIVHGDTARQFLVNGLVSTLVTPLRGRVPLYVQLEINTTTYVHGTAALPPGQTQSPAETVFLGPELFLGPVHGVRAAAGVLFGVYGDPVHRVTYTLTAAFDLPNRFGY